MPPQPLPDKAEYIQRLRRQLADYLKNVGHIRHEQVYQAFYQVPRHLFLPDEDLERVYSDVHIPTKLQDGIPISSSSQPAIMAIMLEELDLQPGQRVLEIGAGTGYNAALMAQIVGETGSIVTIDIDQDIVDAACEHLTMAGYSNVEVVRADGSSGYPVGAPYDRIILTVGAADIAHAWHEQLRPGGRLVLPFKLTRIAQPVLMINWLAADQVLLTLEHRDTHLASRAWHMCGFMPLRGTLALRPLPEIPLQDAPGLSMVTASLLDPLTITQTLDGFFQSDPLSIEIPYHEQWALRLWLALRDPAYCEIYRSGGTASATLQLAAQALNNSMITIGLCENGTFCLLTRLGSDDELEAGDGELVLRTFGTERSLTQRLIEHIIAWDQAGRPFQWSTHGTMEHIHLHVYDKDALYVVTGNAFLVERENSRLVFQPTSPC